MFEATLKEQKVLIDKHNYDIKSIKELDLLSDKVRKGIPVDLFLAVSVCSYQQNLQEIRKSQKRWWEFWK